MSSKARTWTGRNGRACHEILGIIVCLQKRGEAFVCSRNWRGLSTAYALSNILPAMLPSRLHLELRSKRQLPRNHPAKWIVRLSRIENKAACSRTAGLISDRKQSAITSKSEYLAHTNHIIATQTQSGYDTRTMKPPICRPLVEVFMAPFIKGFPFVVFEIPAFEPLIYSFTWRNG